MKQDFLNLILEHNGHSAFLNLDGLMKAVKIVYQQGKEDGNQEVLDWLSSMDYLSDNVDYIKEEWKNQNN